MCTNNSYTVFFLPICESICDCSKEAATVKVSCNHSSHVMLNAVLNAAVLKNMIDIIL